MHEKKIWGLAAKINAGEGNAAEQEELKKLMASHPEMASDIKIIAQFWNYRKTKAIPWQLYTRYAAIMIVLLISAALILFLVGREDTNTNSKTITVANGTKNYLTLPDGSKVLLNAGSTLKYNQVQGDNAVREVFLSGEAFFEVVHREDLPFIIHTGQMDIKDVGTTFNVRAYPAEGFSETTLIEGSVEIIGKDKKRVLLNQRHQKITVFDSGKNIQERVHVNADHKIIAETAWTKDILLFKNETFQQLALQMERYYDIHIIFENDTLKNRKITGAFSNETFSQALNSLQQIIRFDYTIAGQNVTIR